MQINRYFVEKAVFMNVSELQLQLHQAIDTITDSEKLEAVYKILKGTEGGPYKRMSVEEYIEAIDQARQQIKDGKYLSVDELEKESDNW